MTRRQIVSNRSTANQAPVIWKFASGASAFGLFVDADRCWVGNQSGQIFALNHFARVQNQFRLPDGVKCSSIYCFNQAGDRLWKLGTGCGSAFSMQFLGDRLYIVTTDGSFACIDASETGIKAAQAGTIPQAINIKAPTAVGAAVPSNTLETTSNTSQGVIVECFKEGSNLRIRVVVDSILLQTPQIQ